MYNLISYMGSITCVGVPGAFDDLVQPRLFQPQDQVSTHPTHPLYGIAGDIYKLLQRVNRLDFKGKDDSIMEQPSGEAYAEVESIRMGLQNWTPPRIEGGTPMQSTAETRAAAVALQWAAMLWLFQKTGRPDDFDAKTASDSILSTMSLIRPGSQAEAHLLFPLFMAGVVCNSKAGRLAVEYRLSRMEATLGFGNIKAAHRLLEEVWRGANQGDEIDWEWLARTRYPGLVLL